ncbi:flagellar hook-basal body complex protein FliE [Sphingomonas sp. ID1715]|uniref:flagellar hook-basal body complex protein FliE n=1 Tax=Sphingomonas sp. ID1715 TaxID=1656898 RepID=UPI00148886E3|nr:flagellar hook-basal body complex protein FliE [Sphingomonas sp. ID1715]NNM76923.1 flagellar hook-basal body complex protein FliE [Sphingomonas sp. ID1715]
MSISSVSSADRVMAIRAQILERNEALQRAAQIGNAAAPTTAKPGAGNSFGATLEAALKSVNDSQNAASKASEAYERGETVDVAQVMLARQKASIAFEATLQARNKLLSAYKDIMSMPV